MKGGRAATIYVVVVVVKYFRSYCRFCEIPDTEKFRDWRDIPAREFANYTSRSGSGFGTPQTSNL